MPGPGWYPDPQDPAAVRWFDGEAWTEHRQSAESEPAADTAAFSAQEAVAAGGVGAASYRGGYGSPSYDPYGGQGDYASPTADPADPADPVPPLAAGGAARANHAAGGRAKLDRRLILIVALVVVVVAGLVTGGILLFGGGSTASFTYQGKPIADASTTLEQAEANLATIVSARGGVESNSSTRCYFAVAQVQTGAEKTDIDQDLRCGPVLFVDGDPAKTFLSFPVTSTAAGTSVMLTAAKAPMSNNPDSAPPGLALRRPDGKTPPDGSGGLAVPGPRAAAPNVLTAATVTQPSGTKPTTAIIGSLTGGISITDIGPVDRFGTGDNARSAPANQKLYAFRLAGAAGNSGQVNDLSGSTTISVDGSSGRGLPPVTSGQAIVIAVSDTAKSLDLVLTDGGLKQTYSVIDHKPGAANIQVLARRGRSAAVNQTVTATYNYSAKVVFSDHVTGTSQTATITLAGVTLVYRDDSFNATASAPDKALLIPDITYTGSHDGGPYGINTSLLTFTPTGGAAITAKNVSTDPNKLRNVFEVPANVTTGTITIGGTANETFSGTTTTYVLSVAAPMSFPVSFPAN